MSAAVKSSTGPMIITAAGGSVMKAVIDLSAATITPTADIPTAPTTAATAAPARVAVIKG